MRFDCLIGSENEMKRALIVVSIAVTILAGCGRQQASVPVVSRIHTVSIHFKEFEVHNCLFNLLAVDLQLPVVFGEPWAPDKGRRRIYSRVWAGNVNLEPCGPFNNISYATEDFDAMFYGITFEPYESAYASADELDDRGIAHNEPTMFMIVTDPVLCEQNVGVGFIDIQDKEKQKADMDSLSSKLKDNNGGPLGWQYVDEIRVGYTDKENLEKWLDFLKPAKRLGKNLWQVGDSPAIRFIKSDIKEVKAIVINVESLENAIEYLKENGMLGDMGDGQVEINKEKTYGLSIILKE